MSSENLETREKIMRATWKLLEESGGSGVRMSDIAKATGISRQAVYLHFPTRADLLTGTARYMDEARNIDERLAASREATGVDRLDFWVEAWGNYIPEIHGVGRALIAMRDTDEAAAAAWNDRMQAVRHGCEAAVTALKSAGRLMPDYSVEQATDLLWALLSVEMWEKLRFECGWSQTAYVAAMQKLACDSLVS
tara:strand:+ start:2163 stop:2744 length:582 start_codon:yes stop_codon:yes gene_type:complete